MSATANFLSRWRQVSVRDMAVLLRLDVKDTAGATFSIFASTTDVDTPAGAGEPVRGWEPLILDAGKVQDPGAFGGTDVELSHVTMRLYTRRPAAATAYTSMMDFAKTYHFDTTSRARVWLWDARLTTFADALLRMDGSIEDAVFDAKSMELVIRQRAGWNRPVTPRFVSRASHPNALPGAVGLPIPVKYGALTDLEHRWPMPAFPTATRITGPGDGGAPAATVAPASRLKGPKRVGGALLVDTGRGSGVTNPKAKMLVAGHKVRAVADHFVGAGAAYDAGGVLSALEAAVFPADVVNSATEAGLLLADNQQLGWLPVIPNDLNLLANSALNPRAVLDGRNDFNPAVLDWTAGYRQIAMKFPSVPSAGDMKAIYCWVWYTGSTLGGARVRIAGALSGGGLNVGEATLAATAVGEIRGVWFLAAAAYQNIGMTGPWNFGDLSVEVGWPQTNYGGVYTPVTGSGAGEVYCAGLSVLHIPRQVVLESERVTRVEVRVGRSPSGRPTPSGWLPFVDRTVIPATTELQGKFFGNVRGYPDDGEFATSGTFAGDTLTLFNGAATAASPWVVWGDPTQWEKITQVEVGDVCEVGTTGFTLPATIAEVDLVLHRLRLSVNASATTTVTIVVRQAGRLIERPADVIAHALVAFGGETLAQIERGASVPGSFVLARSKMLTWKKMPMKAALSIDADVELSRLVGWVAAAGFAMPTISPFDGKWKLWPWRADAPTTYPRKLSKDMVIGMPTVRMTPPTKVATGMRVSYGADAFREAEAHEVAVTPGRSVGRFMARGMRDAYLTVVAGVNDKLDLNITGVGAATVTLGAGRKTRSTMIDTVRTALGSGTVKWGVAFGGQLNYEANDRVGFGDGASKVFNIVTIATDGNTPEMTMEEIAARVMAKLNASSTNWYCYYTRATRKFTIGRTAGTCQLLFGTWFGNTAAAVLGFEVKDYTGSVSYTGGECEERLFAVAATASFNMLWQTGPNGLDGTKTSCWELLGFDWVKDSLGIPTTVARHLGQCPKTDTEHGVADTAVRAGTKRTSTLDGKAIYDHDTATMVRDLGAVLMCKRRIEVDWKTYEMPDVERGEVIEVDADMNELMAYPAPGSNGSWVGKRFVVVEVGQPLGPGTFATEVSAVALD